MPIRSHVIEASGSSEAWYVPPRGPSLLWPRMGAWRVSARHGLGGVTVVCLSIMLSR